MNKAEALEQGGVPYGICRRRAPVADGIWPVVAHEQWCGEFEASDQWHGRPLMGGEMCCYCRFYSR